MEKLTKERAVQLHRELWTRIAECTQELKRPISKEDIIREMGINSYNVFNQCFCCEYAVNTAGPDDTMCSVCPLYWPGGSCMVDDYDDETGKKVYVGLYDVWYEAYKNGDWQTACDFATIIANLHEK